LLRQIKFLYQLERSQWLSSDELGVRQLRGLQTLIRHVWETVPYYRSRLADAGIAPGAIRGLDCLPRIPLTRKRDLQGLPFSKKGSSLYSEDRVVLLRSSGTMGEPSYVHCDHAFIDLRRASILRTLRANGYRLTDRIAVLASLEATPKLFHAMGLYRRVAIPFTLEIPEQLARLRTLRPEVIDGYPSRLQQIARAIIAEGRCDLRPRLVVANSETLTDSARRDIREAFGVDPVDVYESWEFGQIAWQCRQRQGMHVNADQLIVEILSEGRATEPGEAGEVVVTSWRNRAAPLIRYATGDIAVASPSRCTCGRGLPMIGRITGRLGERIVRSDGSHVMATTQFVAIMTFIPGVTRFRGVQRVKGELEVWVVATDDFDAARQQNLERSLQTQLGLDRVVVRRTNRIEPSPSGKARLLVPLAAAEDAKPDRA
jgi:phenylacetate-CoA ligase